MKTASPAMRGHLQTDCTTLCRLYKITRADGNVYAFTDHDTNIDTTNYQCYITDGGYVYEASIGFSPTASQNKNDLSVDNQEATAFIDSTTIKENELRFGLWDAAVVEIRLINWADLTMGEIKLRYGTLGSITMKNGVMTAEILGLTNKLQVLCGRSFGTVCDAELGDDRCQAVVPVENGSVASSADAHTIVPNPGLGGSGILGTGLITVSNPDGASEAPGTPGVGHCSNGAVLELFNCSTPVGTGATTYLYQITTGIAPVAGDTITVTGFANSHDNVTDATIVSSVPITSGGGFYNDGVMTFTSGGNSGLSYQILSWDGTTLKLNNPLFVAPAVNDTFTISPGCNHDIFDCLNKFDNAVNHRGFPTIPGQDSIINYPDADGGVPSA